ncbi:phospholipid-transporting ATPase ABCA3-like isoform X2 [Diabrotica virgifera virgifera]|uniref:ABC transporter domain-containing protein n=1 Tax=Diabrotica virgifera virgifera TaxID=50390 RepID=A0ABM5L559_DIAVI|nr:phospholipid-transporting ATPase ABCA3-like isoform X2 [Diabrotica virgifera virgifera]
MSAESNSNRKRNHSYTVLQDGSDIGFQEPRGAMAENLDKFILLMWKNWLLQYRKPVQTAVEILAPVIFSILLVVIRSLSDPVRHETVVYPPFCTIPIALRENKTGITICPSYDGVPYMDRNQSDGGNSSNNPFEKFALVYSPSNPPIDQVMNYFRLAFKNVVALESSQALEKYFITNSSNITFAGIQFDDSYKTLKSLDDVKHLQVSIRFPGETRLKLDPFNYNNWRTNLIFPIYQQPGPRLYNLITGAAPSYYREGFLGLQYYLTLSVLLAKSNVTYATDDYLDLISWVIENQFPLVNMRRFPNAPWYEDILLTALKSLIGIIIMLSFVYTCINTVKSITTEKEKQLKESMKIMGLPNWLHWTAWFVKCFMFLLISSVLMVIFLKVRWYTNTNFTVFTKADPFVLLLFLMFYNCATITFCFALSVLFNKANTAATIAGMVWFLSYSPYLFMANVYDTLTLTSKLVASIGSNTAMAFGFQVILMYEGTGEGIQWNNIFTPNTPDDSLTLGLILIMLTVDSIMYLLIALYIEALFPGEFGVPQPWYFPFTAQYWCGHPIYRGVEDFDNGAIKGEFFETEPENLKPGIQIRNLKKVFNQKVAVRNLSLNMYEDQITVLLGHNGAGKTTTMSMLTGMITPNGGTAKISGYDIRTDMEGVRKSLGLCPQHNIIFDELTVAEHIYFFSKLKGMRKGEIKSEIAKYVDLLELQEKRNSKASTLSGGMKRKLCVGVALCGNSKVVMLDEPTAGMDPAARRALWNLLETQKDGRTILLTTHFMDEADILGDRIAIMAGGQLQCCGSSFFLKKKYGAGYSLIMDKSQECDPRRVTQLLKKYIPDIEINSNVGSELTYLLVDDHVHVFEPMLRELETESEMLGIRSYGISLTTLEEVFMKVGADHGQEEMYNHEHGNIVQNGTAQNGFTNGINGTHKTNNGTHTMVPTYSNGFSLLLNQIIAMLLKKFVSTVRSWILLGIQVMMPTLFLIIAFVVARKNKMTGNLPAMPLSLSKFENPVTLVENGTSDYLPYYMKVLEDYGYPATIVDNITSVLLDKTEHHPILVTRRYQAAATFGESGIPDLPFNLPNLTAWFNNNPFHSPAVSLSLMLNSIYRKLGGCDDCTIEFTNSPLPYSAATQASQLLTVQNIGFQLSFNIGFSMSFVASFYVLFVIRENRCKSKHLQFVSGVKVYVFWLTAAFCDMLTYLFTVFVLMITMVMFQEDGFKSGSDISRMFFILFYFGWAFLPMFYLSSYFFQVPSTGYTRMTLVSIFGGNAAFLVVQVLQSPGLDLQYIGNALHWLFLIFPHYSLATGINESFKVYAYNNICVNLLKTCEEQHIPKKTCISIMRNERIREICEDADLNYFKWKAPGIARNMVYSFLTGIILFALLLAIEYKIFSRVHYYLTQKHFTKKPIPVEDEDSDVSKERERIHVATEIDIKQNYTLAVKDLTKYYKNFLAVNGLCVGIRKFECFGLLGINGAGKTSTFMMMTGDTSISYGDAWVNGKSIKQHLEEVQKIIGYCPQFDALLDDMTAEESIIMFAMLRGLPFKDTFKLADYLSKEFDFTRHLKKKVKELSGGNKRKLSTAIALIGDPPLLYLDEPTTGMDPATKRHLWNALCKIRDRGKCIVLTSHSMEECEALCTRIAIMVNGNFKCLGSTQHLKHKFAEGYTLTIKLKKIAESSSEGLSETEPIEKFICQRFPGAQLRERHQELLNYYITNKSVPWSKMFGILEKGKRSDLNIEDYSLGQCSLEQVFLLFTKHENST